MCIFFSSKGSVGTFNTSSYSFDKLFAAAVCTCPKTCGFEACPNMLPITFGHKTHCEYDS